MTGTLRKKKSTTAIRKRATKGKLRKKKPKWTRVHPTAVRFNEGKVDVDYNALPGTTIMI